MGAVNAIQEMLLQSHRGMIRLLPALPKAWPEGFFRGFRAEGGFEVDAEWEGGHLKRARLRSLLGQDCQLKVPSRTEYRITDSKGRSVDSILNRKLRIITFSTKRGEHYQIHKFAEITKLYYKPRQSSLQS